MTTLPTTPPRPTTGIAAWRVLARMLSGILALFVFAYWAAAGWNLGWTKNKIAIKQVDEVTGIDFVTYQDHFAPGVEFLAGCLFLCVVLFVITFFRRKTV